MMRRISSTGILTVIAVKDRPIQEVLEGLELVLGQAKPESRQRQDAEGRERHIGPTVLNAVMCSRECGDKVAPSLRR